MANTKASNDPSAGSEGLSAERQLKPFKPFELDRKAKLAPNPRTLKEVYKCNSRAENLLVAGLTEKLKEHLKSGDAPAMTRFRGKEHAQAISMLLANLFYAHKHDAQVLISRRTEHSADRERNPLKISNKIVVRWCDYMAAAGLIRMSIGLDNQYNAVSSWIEARPALITMLEQAKVTIELCKGAPALVLRDANKKARAIPKTRQVQQAYKRLKASVDALNKMMATHSLTLSGAPVMTFTRRIFNEALQYGGRFYGDFSTFPSADRAKFWIDAEPTVELDYKSIHFYLLYAWEGLQFAGDPYSMPGHPRSVFKAAGLRLLNSENLGAFKRNVTRSGIPKIKLAYEKWQARYAAYHHLEHFEKPKSLKGFIEGMPDNIQGEDVYQAIAERHAPVAHHFGSQKIGLRLQFTDSQIMANAILKAAGRNIPVVPIHDSLICRLRDKAEVELIMRQAYQEETHGFSIPVECK